MTGDATPNEPTPLVDDELAEIVGGASWSAGMESQFSQLFESQRAGGKTSAQTLDEFIKARGMSDLDIACRNRWIGAGSRSDVTTVGDPRGNIDTFIQW